ncbi:class I SAM-dependent RNA methyltransferase [Kocuria palustris]|uniref:class I SAM-dependent RNA methyltransferase n=1 Tax=Kocuria palustris TaxID=71999 RepID=UPI0011A22B66|nr:TRAM domain-containing protein [Kocuria palustris]
MTQPSRRREADAAPAAPGPDGHDAAGQILELELGAPAHGGHTVARTAEGRVVFVRHGAPGERVRVRLTEAQERARFWRGDVIGIRQPAPERRESHPWGPADSVRTWAEGRAPVGGAEFGHLELGLQRRLKGEVLRELLGGIGGFAAEEIAALDPEVEALPGESADGLGWRTRAHFAIDPGGRPAMHPHRAAELTAVEDFPLMVPALRALRVADVDWTGAARLDLAAPSDDAPSVLVTAQRAELGELARRLGRDALPALQAAHEAAGGAGEAALVLQADPEQRGPRPEPVVLSGGLRARERVGRRSWQVSAGGFWQVHRSAPGRLLELVEDAAGLQAGEAGLDLYSGAGLLTAALADAAGPEGSVLAVEGSPLTSSDAAATFARTRQVEAVTGSVEQVLAQRWPQLVRIPQRLRGAARGSRAGSGRGRSAAAAPRPDVVVLDPPRAGAGKVVVDAICALGPRRIVSVSCDPATLARDLARFRRGGWAVRSLRGLDLYPNTHHLETVTVLERE